MARTAHARIAPFAVLVLVMVPSAPLKGGSLNEQRVRLGDGEHGAEAVVV